VTRGSYDPCDPALEFSLCMYGDFRFFCFSNKSPRNMRPQAETGMLILLFLFENRRPMLSYRTRDYILTKIADTRFK